MLSELFLSREGRRVWSLLVEDGKTVEVRAEWQDRSVRVGQVIKARVSNVLPSIQAVFLDVGHERDAFLHASDLPAGGGWVSVEKRVRVGDSLVVQIVRETDGGKGDRASGSIGLPGRLVVLYPDAGHVGISRRIADEAERERLLDCLGRLEPGPHGIVARTAAEGAGFEALRRDVGLLLERWKQIEERAPDAPTPSVLHHELPLPLRVLRDGPAGGWQRIVVDDPELRDQMTGYLETAGPESGIVVELHEGPRPLFDAFGLARDVDRALRSRVWLDCGGYVIIEPTEALVSVDVNTGKSTRGNHQEATIQRANLEAAVEIGRQLRLRDLGGIIVVDFIDMADPDSWEPVLRTFEQALQGDPARTKIVGLSELGLVQLTRKRTRAGLQEVLTEACPHCEGAGRVRRSTD